MESMSEGAKEPGEPPATGRRVAFFGGSFDPPHKGHLAIAHAARTALGLDSILFAPVGAQPLKPNGLTASFEDRLAMTRLAIACEPEFAVSLADAPKPSGAPNYTLETSLASSRGNSFCCKLDCCFAPGAAARKSDCCSKGCPSGGSEHECSAQTGSAPHRS